MKVEQSNNLTGLDERNEEIVCIALHHLVLKGWRRGSRDGLLSQQGYEVRVNHLREDLLYRNGIDAYERIFERLIYEIGTLDPLMLQNINLADLTKAAEILSLSL